MGFSLEIELKPEWWVDDMFSSFFTSMTNTSPTPPEPNLQLHSKNPQVL